MKARHLILEEVIKNPANTQIWDRMKPEERAFVWAQIVDFGTFSADGWRLLVESFDLTSMVGTLGLSRNSKAILEQLAGGQ
jgi:hypothetical protein